MSTATAIVAVLPSVVHLFTWVAGRIRARRAARKAGHAKPVDPACVAKGVKDALDLADEITHNERPSRMP